jgi:hypothetical protein
MRSGTSAKVHRAIGTNKTPWGKNIVNSLIQIEGAAGAVELFPVYDALTLRCLAQMGIVYINFDIYIFIHILVEHSLQK